MAGDRKNERKEEERKKERNKRSKKWRNIFNKLMNKESQEQVNKHNLTNKRLTEWNKKKEIQNKANECNIKRYWRADSFLYNF